MEGRGWGGAKNVPHAQDILEGFQEALPHGKVVRGKRQQTEHLEQLRVSACKLWDFSDAAICFKHIYNIISFHVHISHTKIEVLFPSHSCNGRRTYRLVW